MSTLSEDETLQKILAGVPIQETSLSHNVVANPRGELDLWSGGSGPGGATGSVATGHHDDADIRRDVIKILLDKIVDLEARVATRDAEIRDCNVRDALRERTIRELGAQLQAYRQRHMDMSTQLMCKNMGLMECNRQLTTLKDVADECVRTRLLLETAAKKRDEYALDNEHHLQETRKLSQRVDQLEARLQDAQQSEAEWRRKVGDLEADKAMKIAELRALVAHYEALPRLDIQVRRRPNRAAAVAPNSAPAKRKRFTLTKSEAPQCRQCDTVFTDRDPGTVPCRFHAHPPLLYKTWLKQEDPSAIDPPKSGKLLYWPCCKKLGTAVPVGCRELRNHDIAEEFGQRC